MAKEMLPPEADHAAHLEDDDKTCAALDWKQVEPGEELKKEIANRVRKHPAGHAAPREIELRDTLPKTRSGKIMRRVLKAWDQRLPVGDLATLED